MTDHTAVQSSLKSSSSRGSKGPSALRGRSRNLLVPLTLVAIGSLQVFAQDGQPVGQVTESTQSMGQDSYVSPSGHAFGERSRQVLVDGFKAAKQKDFAGFMAVAAPRYIQHSPDLADGWKPVWDLLAKRPAGFSSRATDWMGPKGMLDNGHYLVMLREVNRGDGTPPSKIVDIMLFDDNGKYAEHWDIRQALSDKTASGRSETEPADVFAKDPVSYSEEIEKENVKTAAAFLQLAFNDGKLGEALDRYVAKDYVQHNPLIADGTAPVKAIFEAGGIPPLKYDIELILAQNDIVVVFSKVEAMGKQSAVVDILRIRDGVLVEHWDVVQEVPSAEEMPHTNGMFSVPPLMPQSR